MRVNSKAYNAGLDEKDIITYVGDKDVSCLKHKDVMRAVEQGGDNLTLTILRYSDN